jgi:hypothetical protein
MMGHAITVGDVATFVLVGLGVVAVVAVFVGILYWWASEWKH